MDEVVANVADLAEAVDRARSTFKTEELWFRGQAFADWRLVPKVHRQFTVDHESTMISKFRYRAGTRFAHCPSAEDAIGWLCLMQHYGLPTRLLDWCESILVAAFFALCYEDRSGPAAIWVLSPGHLNATFGRGHHVFHMGHPEPMTLIEAAILGRPPVEDVYAVVAPEVDARMMVQQGVFTVHGSPEPLDQHGESDRFLMKFTIPEPARDRLTGTLEALGLRLSFIFPDLPHLAREISTTHSKLVERGSRGNPPGE